jgi:RNA polymerase sigma-70 factor (TIGR02960 family)
MTRSAFAAPNGSDDEVFGEVVGPYLAELHLHCYRLLGSVTDADDILQEVLLGAWRGWEGFAGRSSVRTWLYRIATNRCLNAIRDGKRRPPPEPLPPFDPPAPSRRSDVTWLQPYPDTWLRDVDVEAGPAARYEQREAVELAFIAALQRLPPRQTASLLLCDVLGYSTTEAAAILDTTATAAKGSLQRARASLHRLHGKPGRPAGTLGSDADRALARRFADAFIADDIDGVLALLSDNAWLAMPPAPHEYQCLQAIAFFLRASVRWKGSRATRLLATGANNQPAFATYLTAPDSAIAHPTGLIVLTIREHRIHGLTRFLDPHLPRSFGQALEEHRNGQ